MTYISFVLFRIGDGVPFAKKGRFGVVHGSVEEHFNPYHLMVETGNKDDLQEEELIRRVNIWLQHIQRDMNRVNLCVT